MKNLFKKITSLAVLIPIAFGNFVFSPYANAMDIGADIQLSNTKIEENVDMGTVIGKISSSSVNATYSLESEYLDNFRFKIENDELKTDFSPNYERVNIFNIRIIKNIDEKKSYKDFKINIIDINKEITGIKISSSKIDLTENLERTVGYFTAIDDMEDGKYVYTIIKNAKIKGKVIPKKKTVTEIDGAIDSIDNTQNQKTTEGEDIFKMVGNTLKVVDNIDITNGVYNIRINVNDGKYNFEKSFSVNISGAKTSYESSDGISLDGILKNVAIGFAVCFAQGTAYSLPAQAADVLSVPTNGIGSKMVTGSGQAKECGLDYMANALKNQLLLGIVRSTTEWVKGGFEGKPAFMESPTQFLENITDEYVGKIIEGSELTKPLCSNFKIPLKFAINLKFYGKGGSGSGSRTEPKIPTCTLSKALGNIENAFGDLENFYSNGGSPGNYWEKFTQANTNPSNTASGSFLHLSKDLENLIGEKNKQKLDDVARGNGYQSMEVCEDKGAKTYRASSARNNCSEKFNKCKSNSENTSGCQSQYSRCLKRASKSNGGKKCKYVTPGKVIADEVSGALGIERENLLLADEFDELISALITQLMEKIFNGGLSNVSAEDITPVEKNIDAEKKALLATYNIEAYNLEIEITEELEKTSIRFLDFLTDLKKRWQTRKDNFSDDNKKWRQSEKEPKYSVLTMSTIDDNIEQISMERKRAIDKLILIRNKVAEIKENKKTGEEARELIKASKSIKDLNAIFEGSSSPKAANIGSAFSEYRKYADKYERIVNGKVINYNISRALWGGGLISSKLYLSQFNKGRSELCQNSSQHSIEDCNLVSEAQIKPSLDWYGIKSLTFDEYRKTLIKNESKYYELTEKIQDYNYSVQTYNLGYGQDPESISLLEGVDNIEDKYWSIISSYSPSNVSGDKIDNWKDFFSSEKKIILDKNNLRFGKSYLAHIYKTKALIDYDEETKESYTTYNYNLFNIPIMHYALYPNGLGEKEVDGLKGQGMYRTSSTNRSWESYKVFIPPFAKKMTLMFKTDKEDYSDYLYRMHLTFGEDIDHRNVKTLKFSDNSDSNHSSLRDLFVNKKTVLVNILDSGNDLGDEQDPGINNMGIILGEKEISKYIGEKGGWLYFDIIKDDHALRERDAEVTNLDIMFYLDIDRNDEAFKSWIEKADNYLEEKDAVVVDIDTEE